MLDIQSVAAEIKRRNKKDRKKPQGKNIMACPMTYAIIKTPRKLVLFMMLNMVVNQCHLRQHSMYV